MNSKTKSVRRAIVESKQLTFMDSGEWSDIVHNIKSVYTSDGTMITLLDWERVLEEADLYAFKNWHLGELVDGPVIGRYSVSATLMWPRSLMPDPRGAKRLLPLGCVVKFKKTTVKNPIQVKDPEDFMNGTNYPKLVDRQVWLVNITVPKSLMNDIREGSIDLAEQTIDLEDLDASYEADYDDADTGTDDGDAGGDDFGDMGDFGGAPMGSPPAPGLGM